MRWLFTDDHPLAAALAAAGESIIDARDAKRQGREAETYRSVLRRALSAHSPDVLCVVSPADGFSKKPITAWPGQARGRCVVFVQTGDPARYLAYGRFRKCWCRPNHCGVYVTDALKTATFHAEFVGRAALWSPGSGVAHILAAVATVVRGRSYETGKKAKPWTP